jgi:hypothetical protein
VKTATDSSIGVQEKKRRLVANQNQHKSKKRQNELERIRKAKDKEAGPGITAWLGTEKKEHK